MSTGVDGLREKKLKLLNLILTSIAGLKLIKDMRPLIAPGCGSPSITTTLSMIIR